VRASFDAANRMRSITFTGAGTSANAGSSDISYTLSYDQNGNLTQKQENKKTRKQENKKNKKNKKDIHISRFTSGKNIRK
jgi:hypothetical protein